MISEETIAAMATPAGRAAIAVLRVSGPKAQSIGSGLFVDAQHRPKPLIPFKPVLGFIYDAESRTAVDQVLVTYFQAPHSFTGEDVVEIACHGSPVLAGKILELLVSYGATLAQPGEFSMRAFLNGKMDLSQAEAIRDAINAQTYFQARIATAQRDGSLSKQLQPLKQGLLDLACHLESKVEFVEEDLETDERSVIGQKLHRIYCHLQTLQATFKVGRIIHDGFSLALVGCPNVGKSSLFNALLRSNRAIVTDTPGTTRDLLSESANIGGVPVRLVDTAGIRQESGDPIERVGMEKSLEAIADADMVLFVLDGSRPLSVDDWALHRRLLSTARPFLLILNKSDLPQAIDSVTLDSLVNGYSWIAVSALKGTGLDLLHGRILDSFAPSYNWDGESSIVTSVRHQNCIHRCVTHIESAERALAQGLSEEFVLYDLHNAHRALGQITGEVSVEDVLSLIFSTFCVGK